MSTASQISVGDDVLANLSDGKDQDWYKFKPTSDGLYTTTFTGGSATVDMVSASGQKLRSTSRTGISYSLKASTTYYVKVSKSGLKASASFCYHLSVTSLGSAPAGMVQEYEDLKSAARGTLPEGIFKLWPNPTYDGFLLYNGKDYPVHIRITVIAGRMIEEIENLNSTETISFGTKYTPGIYLIESSGNGVREVIKAVKM